MGWDFTKGASKQDVVKEILSGGGKPEEFLPIAHKVVGRCLWVVWEHNSVDRNARFIGLYFLDKNPGYGWGYKAMEESQGPYEVSCPLQFLDITPLPDSPYSQEWRDKVREYHRSKSGQLAIKKKTPSPSYCGECLTDHVDCVPLNADGTCNCCATQHRLAGKVVA